MNAVMQNGEHNFAGTLPGACAGVYKVETLTPLNFNHFINTTNIS